ncbi:MAG: hypothetical protein ABH851_02965, partial [Methanobacteriota archaeon]
LLNEITSPKRSLALGETRTMPVELSGPEMNKLASELARFLESADDEVFTAARLLHLMGDSAVGTLMNVAGDAGRSDRSRYAAVYALGKSIGTGEVNPSSFKSVKGEITGMLTDIAESDMEPKVREAAVDAVAGMLGYLNPTERSKLRDKLDNLVDGTSPLGQKAKTAVEKIDAMKLGEKPLSPDSLPKKIDGVEKVEWKQVVENPTKTIIHIKQIHSLYDVNEAFTKQHWRGVKEGFGSPELDEMAWLILDAEVHVRRNREAAYRAMKDLARQGVSAIGIEGLLPSDMPDFERVRDELMSPARPEELNPGKVQAEGGPGWLAEYQDPNVEAFPVDDEYTNRVRRMIDSGDMPVRSKAWDEAAAERERRATQVMLNRIDANVIIYYGGDHKFLDDVAGKNVNVVELTPEHYDDSIERMKKMVDHSKEHNIPGIRISMFP